MQRSVAKVVHPFAWRAKTKALPPLPEDSFFAAPSGASTIRWRGGRGPEGPEKISVRLATNAEKMFVAESWRAFTYLTLYDYAADAVVVNRLLPYSVSDPYFERRREA